jgi:tetratricopeptide (TPR) repeat protein
MRDQAQVFLSEIAKALSQPNLHPILFNIWGIGGVGKTTLLEQLEVEYEQQACFVVISFGVTQQVETSLELMDMIEQELNKQLSNSVSLKQTLSSTSNGFISTLKEYRQTIVQLKNQPIDGKIAVDSEQQNLAKKLLELENIAALPRVMATQESVITDGSSAVEMSQNVSSCPTCATPTATLHASLKKCVQRLLEQHPATKHKKELQELMMEPLPQLTQAFVEGLIQKAETPLVLVLDTYEKAPREIDNWLWQHLLANSNLKPHKVRIVVAGRYPLLEESGKQNLLLDRDLVYEQRLDEFNKEQAKVYLQRIGINRPREIQQIYRVTRGLPYYLNWIEREKEADREIDFSRSNPAISHLFLQGLNLRQKQLVQMAACCRWFNRVLMRKLTVSQGLDFQTAADENFDCFEWLTQRSFVEFVQGSYRLDDVARDDLRLSLWQDDREQFHQVNAILADYFERLAASEVPPEQPEQVQYENPDWRHYTAECLYYTLFSRSGDYQSKFLTQLFVSRYLGESQVVRVPLEAIAAEADLANHPLLPYATRKFLIAIRPAVEWGYLVLEAEPIDVECLVNCGFDRVQIETTLEVCFSGLNSLQGLAKFAALLYQSRRCPPNQKLDYLRLALAQAERIAVTSDSEFSSDLFLGKVGKAFHNLSCYEAAIASYDKALEFKPASDAAWYRRGLALSELKRYEEAIASYNKALEFKPDDADTWYYRGIVLRKVGRYEDAIASYQKALEFNGEHYEAWNCCGIALRKLGRLDEALASYNKALEFQLDDSRIWYNRGIVLDDLGCWEDAVASYDKALEFQLDDHEAWYNRGIALRKLGRLDEALASYDQALEFKLDDPVIWYNRGYLLDDLGRFDEAIASYDKVLELQPNDSGAWFNRGLALGQLGRLDEAIVSYDKALELQTDKDQSCWYNRSIALHQLGRLDEAIASYERVLELQPDSSTAWYNKACCYALQGNVELAIGHLEQAISLSPVQCREMARTDSDFDNIRALQPFQELVKVNS